MLSVFSSRTDSITCRVLAVDRVAVVVDVDEVVVRPDLLDLRERLQQRLVIPQPHVLDRAGVGDDVLRRQLGVARHLALLDAIERVGAPRRRDVVDDVRLFLVLLVRRDDEALHGWRRRGRRPWTRRSRDATASGSGQPRRLKPYQQRQSGADDEHDERRPEERKRGVDVGVGRAEGHGDVAGDSSVRGSSSQAPQAIRPKMTRRAATRCRRADGISRIRGQNATPCRDSMTKLPDST